MKPSLVSLRQPGIRSTPASGGGRHSRAQRRTIIATRQATTSISSSIASNEESTHLPGNPRMQRAPTITIDTSTVSPVCEMNSLPSLDNPPPPLHSRTAPLSDSRPTSPHNVSSPTSRGTTGQTHFSRFPGHAPPETH
jgi:hypothetical protein